MTITNYNALRIIIASENHNFKNILASKLRLENFDVELASGGFHLLHLLEIHPDISMIIFNEDMNDMSALEIIGLVRLSKNKTELPILFISKNNSEEETCDLIFAGANEYVVQTTNYQPIIERAHKYLHQIKTNVA